jgi:small-conductance mechanosensitive channel
METTLNKESKWPLSEGTKRIIVDVIVYLFVALFVYTAASKIMTYESFEKVLHGSPLIGNFSYIIAWLIPFVEIALALMLLIPATQKIGLYLSLGLMIFFTVYLIYMVLSGNRLPCSCGGVISKLSWRAHIWFNMTFVILALIGLRLYKE